MYKNLKFVFMTFFMLTLVICAQAFASAAKDDFATVLQEDAGYMPTYGGYNYHIAEINGIYFLGISEYVNDNDYGTIRIKKSTDKGHTWTDFYVNNQKTTPQAPTLLSDTAGRLHVIWGSWYAEGCYMRFPDPLNSSTPDYDRTWPAYCNAKNTAVYDSINDVIYWSHRRGDVANEDNCLYISKLDITGNRITDTKVINTVGYWNDGNDHWRGYYHSMYVDNNGRLHLLYNIYHWPNSLNAYGSLFVPAKVGYMYSDDGGISWKRANGTSISIPFSANDFNNGGTLISASNESNAFLSNILVKNNKIHILYKSDALQGLRYVRLDRSTGVEEKRTFLAGGYIHAVLVEDKNSNDIYIFHINESNYPALMISKDNGDSWNLTAKIDNFAPKNDFFFSATAAQAITNDGSIIGMFSDFSYSDPNNMDADFANFKIRGRNSYYRFEKTASNNTAVTDGASLRLDGQNQVKDESGTNNGNPYSTDNVNFGTYESTDGSVIPVPAYNINGTASNGFFAKLNAGNAENINLGNLSVGTGLTIEGWFCPTGNSADWTSNGRIISKGDSYRPGDYWMHITDTGKVLFGIYDPGGARAWLLNASNKVVWGQWNYIGVTWTRDSKNVEFYIKQPNGTMYHETVTNSAVMPGFPTTSDNVRIGHNAAILNAGFTGYIDEVRISDYSLSADKLLAATDESYYRFEKTASGTTSVSDGASLRLDGTNQIKDETGVPNHNGNPFSQDNVNFGTYESSDGYAAPVPYTKIRNAVSNNFFAKMDFANQEGFNLGNQQIGAGLTLEGWFYPTGNSADWTSNGRLISKGDSYRPGDYWLHITDTGKVLFGIYDPVSAKAWQLKAANKVLWNQWNYIAVTWTKDSTDIDIYIKQPNGEMYHETVTNSSVVTGFPVTDDSVKAGYNSAILNAGFTGYMDEVRISNFKRSSRELLAVNDSYFRFENTASGVTAVTDGASLRLDGTYQVKDETDKQDGNASSYDNMNFGTYQSTDGAVAPVPYTEIRGAASNNFFAKLSSLNKEEVNLGYITVGTGLTLEGWFYPASQLEGPATLISKSTCYQMQIDADGSVVFELNPGDVANNRLFRSNAGLVKWGQWNYIAVSWVKNTNYVVFYVKQAGTSNPLNYQAVDGKEPLPALVKGTSLDTTAVKLGGSFEGYADEIRISICAREMADLLVLADSSVDLSAADWYYRFENTVSGITSITDGASLRLDGSYNVKNDRYGYSGANPYSQDGVNFGTYESVDGTAGPVSFMAVKGITSNRFFGKMSFTNREGIDLGQLQVRNGVTLEGWFYPTGDPSGWASNGLLISKGDSYGAGDYRLQIADAGKVQFTIYDPAASRSWLLSAAGKVVWNQWNYIAVTWAKDSTDVDIYIKQPDSPMYHETLTNTSVTAGFPISSGSVKIGCNPAIMNAGFTGYVDEVRISNYKLQSEQLLAADVAYYRLEQTASNVTPVSDDASLRLDGANQIKDEAGRLHGNPVSLDGTNFGTYQNADGTVTPVTNLDISGGASNSFFGKLSSANQEGVSLGDLDAGSGLTLEGWFYPTGNVADADDIGRLITKCSSVRAGNYSLKLNSSGGVTFEAYDPVAMRTWNSASGVVQWNQWNYIAVRWKKDSQEIEFNVKPQGGQMYNEIIKNADVVSGFPNTDDNVTIGYNAGVDKGYDGYFDEVRISDYSLERRQMLFAGQHLYKFDNTVSGATVVRWNSSLRTDGDYQVKDETGAVNGNPFSQPGTSYGIYNYGGIRGQAVAQLSNSKKEGINLGDLDVGSGLTLEGWFCYQGNIANAYDQTRMITKLSSWRPGVYWLCLTSDGRINFGVYDVNSGQNGISWYSSQGLISPMTAYYIAVTWQKNSNTVDFYVSDNNSSITHETVTVPYAVGGFPNINDDVTLGYSTGMQRGFEGFMEKVRISNWKVDQSHLEFQPISP